MNLLLKRPPIEALNLTFKGLTFEQRINQLYEHFDESEVLVTSSFGVNSAFLLHLLSKLRPSQKIHFIDTTYHFEETLAYKKYLTKKWKLNIELLRPDPELNALTRNEKLWEKDPDRCCAINKVEPLAEIKKDYKIWISGLMAFQTPFRAGLELFEKQDSGIIKFHPLIDMSEMLYLAHTAHYQLPAHPLQFIGYGSVGCTHCTQKGEGRDGRWKDADKTECGLHL
jgi:phosphoadenosine phosphosulfate reductase